MAGNTATLKVQVVMKIPFPRSSGALSDMPAVQAFAMYAGMSLLINFVLQMTLFVSLFSLDVMREEVSEAPGCVSLFSAKKLTDHKP